MHSSRTAIALFVATIAWVGSAAAQQYRCDCTSVVDTCAANVEAHGSFLEVKTDHQQCARVDYFVDGLPFVSVVVGGEDRQNWPARTADPKIMVQSCQVCRDNGNAAAPAAAARPTSATPTATASAEAGEAKKIQPLIAGTPEYPAAARARRVEGHVDVEFTVNAFGNVENAHVIASQPSNVFDSAALTAVGRWRYRAEAERAPFTLTERVSFKLDSPAVGRATAAERDASSPRNQCVREDAIYNYGETVDVGLINACGQPLLVFGCAEGTGRYAGRWTCNDSEAQGSVLVAASDRRLGGRVSLPTGEGVRVYTYTDSFSVTRTPNSQYWVVACSEQDADCRANARQWTRAVGGQPASVNPQDRSRLPVMSSR